MKTVFKSYRSRFLITYWINIFVLVNLIGSIFMSSSYGGGMLLVLAINMLAIISIQDEPPLKRRGTKLEVAIEVIIFFVLISLFSMSGLSELKADINDKFDMITDIVDMVASSMVVSVAIVYAWRFRKEVFHHKRR